MTDSNVQLHAALLYWYYSHCNRNPNSTCRTDRLVENFNNCMEQTGLAPKLGRSALELLLNFVGLESYVDNGVTFWTGIDLYEPDPLDFDPYLDPAFPEIFG